MKRRMWLLGALLTLLWTTPAAADNRFIVRSNLGSQALSQLCLLQSCTVVRALDGTLNQLFLLTAPNAIDPTALLNILRNTPGIVDAELDQLVSMVGGLNQVTTPPPGLSDTTPVSYFGVSVWDGYANQPAALVVRVSEAQNAFHVAGAGIVADVDTGVDPTHPALKAVLLPGFDFTRDQPNGSELTDFTQPPGSSGNSPTVAKVNQSTVAVLDQSTVAVLDGKVQYAAFGHGTMVMGIIHLVAPRARLMPLKAFRSDGTGFLSDILRAIYYAVQNNANVLNMSFDFKTKSQELALALDYANQLNVISVASAGNDGRQELVYPAALRNAVMGVASTSDLDARSSFSNYGDAVVWIAAPGEAVITTYPSNTYAAGWGTSFSAPFVSGAAALLLNQQSNINQFQAASAVAHAQWVGNDMGNGRLDLFQALGALPSGGSLDFTVSASPSTATITAGQSANFTLSVTPSGGFSQTVTWSCTGAPAAATCTVSPSSVTLDGTSSKTVMLTVQTMARSVLTPGARPRFVRPPIRFWGAVTACLAWLLVLAMLWNLSLPSASRQRLGLSVAVVLLVAMLCSSCGGGAGVVPPPQPQGTPPSTSTITVTGSSGNVSHTTTVSLTVN